MGSIRNLVRELHRRSVWQVLGVYLVGSWGALQVVDLLTDNYGLPDWVPPFALVLLVIGLPIVLATAVVQEGAPSRDTWTGSGSSVPDPTALLEGEPHPLLSEDVERDHGSDEVLDSSGRAGSLHRLFTWRNAILGGVGAATVLGLAVAGYFFMWSAGIGPVGSLVAQGVLDEREEVVLAEFDNSTSDAALGEVVTDAFRVDLVRSPILSPVDPAFVHRVLERMDRDPVERLTPALAREIAQREGLKAVVQGEVAATGSRYVLTASLVAAEDGQTLAAFRETAESPEAIIDAVDRLSQRLREKAGESLPSIKGGEPLSTVTTGSLDALRLYSRAQREFDAGDGDRAVALLTEALEVDPEFAMAHRQLGAIYRNRGEREKATEAITRAYELRDRLTDRERYHAVGLYHQFVTEDREQTVQAYRNVLDLHPADGRALNNLGVLYSDAGERERAVEMYRKATKASDASSTAFGNLIQVLVNLDQIDEAWEAVERYRESYGEDHPSVRFYAQRTAAFAGRWERADSLAAVRLADRDVAPQERMFMTAERAIYDAARGRFQAADAHLEDALRPASDGELPGAALFIMAQRAEMARIREGDAEAVSLLHREMPPDLRARRDSIPGALLEHAGLYARTGRPDSARALLGRVSIPEASQPGADSAAVLLARAEVALVEGRAGEAIDLARAARSDEACGARCGLSVLGRAHEAAERPDSAAAAYEKWVEEPHWDRFVDYFVQRGPILEDLCRLHHELGHRERAVQRCREFVELWSDADEDLRPRVRAARERF